MKTINNINNKEISCFDLGSETSVSSNNSLDYFFEGAEKRLEVQFMNSSNSSCSRGMLNVSREKWEKLLSLVNCQILSVSQNSHFTSYVLSESSLFVFARKIMIKTCGNTTLLACVPPLLQYAQENHLSVDYITYSHKNFLAPQRQTELYQTFDTELEILNNFFDGKAQILGPIGGDRWFVFQSFPNSKSIIGRSEQKIEILMSELDCKAMSQFYKGSLDRDEVSSSSGICDIIPGSRIDAQLFDPCGYSMNGLYGETYSTIHVTPEESFSYVSYECNLKTSSYDDIIKRVLSIFKPGKFLVVIYADNNAQCKADNAFSPTIPGYQREVINSSCFSGGSQTISCSNFVQTK